MEWRRVLYVNCKVYAKPIYMHRNTSVKQRFASRSYIQIKSHLLTRCTVVNRARAFGVLGEELEVLTVEGDHRGGEAYRLVVARLVEGGLEDDLFGGFAHGFIEACGELRSAEDVHDAVAADAVAGAAVVEGVVVEGGASRCRQRIGGWRRGVVDAGVANDKLLQALLLSMVLVGKVWPTNPVLW